MDRMQIKSSLRNIWQKSGMARLARRERRVLLGGLVFIVVFAVFQLVVGPSLDARRNLEQSIERKKQELAEIRVLQQEYRTLRKEEGTVQARINEREAGFTLFTFLDRQAEAAKVKKQIKYMKPSTVEGDNDLDEAMVEMKLQQIPLADLVAFILLVESEKNVVFIRRLSIQESGNEEGFLDAIMQIVTFEKKG
jgi:general secretion pathway protein M